MVPFDWADPFRLEDQLTDEERMIRDAAHGFAQDTLQPRVIEAFRDEIDAPELFALMGEAATFLRRGRRMGDVVVGFSLPLLVLTGVGAVVLGLMLANGGHYPHKLVAPHRNFTILGLTFAAVARLMWSRRRSRWVHRGLLGCAAGAMMLGAHFGGSMTHGEAAHERGTHNMFTWYRPSPALQYPSLGSVVSHEYGPKNNLPPYVCIPSIPNVYAGTGYLSSSFSPFSLGADPADNGFRVQDLNLPGEIKEPRFASRRKVLDAVNGYFAAHEKSDNIGAMDTFYQRAYSLISSEKAREAFNIAAEALHGELGDLASSVYAMAMLFALDRAGAVDEIAALRREHDVVIMDRYVASNAAYTAARLHQDAAGPAVQWIHALEYQRLGLPAPDWQVLLAVPAELAGRRARSRAESDPGRARDSYERDDGLQQRTGAVYAELAAAGWGGSWLSVDADVDPGRLAADLAAN